MENFRDWFVRTRGHAWPVDTGTGAKAVDVHEIIAKAQADWADVVQDRAMERVGNWDAVQ